MLRTGAKPATYAEALSEPVDHAAVRRSRRRRRDAHGEQRRDHGDVADRVHEKADSLAEGADENARDRRPDEARCGHHRRVERDRVREILLALDHLDDERLARRHVEGVDGAENDGEHDEVPDLGGSRQDEDRESRRLKQRERLRDHDGAVAVPSVGEHAGEGGDEKRGNLPGETDDAEKERGMRQTVDEPDHRDLLHPRADEGNALSPRRRDDSCGIRASGR